MYIKNNSLIIESNLLLKNKFISGNVVSGKLISLDENKGMIKLFDGTIIPVILKNENNIDKNKIIRFKVEGVENNLLILRALNIPTDNHSLDSPTITGILKDLSIPKDTGAQIIDSLIRFNLPANTENILKVYNNHIVLSVIKNYTEEDILNLLKKYILKDSELTKAHLIAAKDILNTLRAIDINFLSFLIENDIPQDINGIIKTSDFIMENYQENLLELLNNLISLKSNSDISKDEPTPVNYKKNEDMINLVSTLKSELNDNELRKITDRLDILKHLRDNYNIYNFNSFLKAKKYENTIIIKNRIKGSQHTNFNELKAFMSIRTPCFGVINCYIIKNTNNISINLGVKKEYVEIFAQNNEILKSMLKENKLTLSSFSVKEQITPEDLIGLSLFFNNNKPLELDVRI